MALTRGVLIGLAGCALALLASHVFNGRASELLIVPVVVTLVALTTDRFGVVVQITATVIAVIAGTMLAVVIGGGSPRDVIPGVGDGPRRLLSTEWPSPLDPTIIAVLGLVVGVCTGAGVVLACRERWRLLPLLPIVVGATALLALSAPVRPSAWLLVGLGVIATAFALTGQPRSSRGAPRRFAVDRTVVATVAVVAVATFLTAGAVAWADRADPRSTDEPNVTETLLDPIEATVAMRNADPVVDLMTISDRSPLARPTMPSRWRLAAFDVYDGQRWVPSVDLRPIGGRLAPEPTDDADVLVYGVNYHGDWIDLVPFPGRPLSVDRDVETDIERVAVRLAEPPDAGTVIEARAVPEPSLADAVGLTTAFRQIDEIALAFADQARRLAGEDGTAVERLGRLAQTMRTDWELDSEAPGAGMQRSLIELFIADTQRGTREQFATAFALLARSIGFDARVAVGFRVPAEALGSTFALRTEYAAVWPEVRLEDGTWLAFDPVPDSEATNEEVPPPPPQAQSPAAVQPPIEPPSDDQPSEEEVVPDEEAEASRWGSVAGWAARVGAVTGLLIAPFLVAIAVIVWIKWRRRRSRLRADDPTARVRGAWANTTDSLVDAGLTIPPSWTDDHIAAASPSVVVGVPHEARRLAAMSSAVTFGTRSRDESGRLATDASTTSASIDSAIRASRTRWERIRWRLSLRSLRRRTRSPVTP